MSEPIEFYIRSSEISANASQFVADVMPDDKKPVCVTITDYKTTRSKKQNSLLFGGIYPQISQQTGYTKAEIHKRYKRQFAVDIFIRDDPGYAAMVEAIKKINPDDKALLSKEIIRLTSTTNFSTKQMAEFITEVLNDCYHKGLTIHLKDDDKKLLQ